MSIFFAPLPPMLDLYAPRWDLPGPLRVQITLLLPQGRGASEGLPPQSERKQAMRKLVVGFPNFGYMPVFDWSRNYLAGNIHVGVRMPSLFE